MPLYMDVHNLQGTTAAQVDQAHVADLKEQGKYGVKYSSTGSTRATARLSASSMRPVLRRRS